MMEGARQWLTGIVMLCILCAAADTLMPEGAVRKVGRLVCAMSLLCVMLRPVGALKGMDLGAYIRDYAAGVEEMEFELSGQVSATQKEVIEEHCAAYIADKAAQLGVVCRVEVDCEATDEGIWLPRRVRFYGDFSDVEQSRMTQFLARQFGVGVEGQSYFIPGEAEP